MDGPALSLRQLESLARQRLDAATYDFFAGGAGDEVTLRANERAFARIGLVPRVLRGAAERRLHTTLLGVPMSMPVVLAPTAFHRLADDDGERATARAAAAAGVVMIVSMASTVAVEEVAKAAADGPPPWFQLYLQPDRGATDALVDRVEQAGCGALVVTVDSPVFGRRERDLRNGFLDLPAHLACENLRNADGVVEPVRFTPDLGWRDIDRLRERTRLPVVLKGVTHPADAELAVRHGVAAIVVSNHGGRQLDTVPASVELLAPIADAVGGRVPILLDGGVRRGTDVVKALALGAAAVGIGRPVLWGLAAAGSDGVATVLDLLRAELDAALALCGCATPREAGPELVRLPGGSSWTR